MSENAASSDQDETSSSPPRQVALLPPPTPAFYEGLHIRFLENLVATMDTSFEGALLEHLRVSGVYWLQTAWCLLSETPPLLQDESLWDWIFSCFDIKSGGFGGHTGQDGHLLYTLSALQVLALGDRLSDDRLQRERVIQFIVERQQSSDGSFTGDAWGETDTRFTYCALQSLALLQAIDRVNVDAACAYIMACRNADGSFGSIPGAESHAGQVFTCVGALAIAQRLDLLQNTELEHDHALAVWLSERQVDSGGLNGRPEKQADVCYSWWILSTLAILGKTRWVNRRQLANFILSCQDDIDGGIADRPDDMADVYHTFFGIAGLSLLGYLHPETEGDKSGGQVDVGTTYQRIDPIYALPTLVVRKLGLPGHVIEAEGEPVDDRLTHYTILKDSVDERK